MELKNISENNNQVDHEEVELILTLAKSYKQKGYSQDDIFYKVRKNFSEISIDYAFKILEQEFENNSTTESLRAKKDYFGWYDKQTDKTGEQWQALRNYLLHKESSWSKDMIDSLDQASTAVVSHLAPPKSEKSIKVKGLVLGYIQSGKTANFSATIAKAVDEGYKLIVVLAGMHNNLRKQTETRLRSELVSPLDSKTCTTLTDVDDQGDFKRKQSVSANSQLNRKEGFVLVVLKKNSTVLRNFNSWLNDANPEVLKNCPVLVIDDESDQASINTNKANEDPTAINNHIRTMFEKFHVASYVGYTATPFANIFIDASIQDDLYPSDFLVTLAKPDTYYGPEELFGRREVNGNSGNEGLPVIRSVPDSDALDLQKTAKKKEKLTAMPESMKIAIKSFLLSGGARLTRGQWKEHITMLIHTSHLVDTHDIISDIVKEYIQELQNDITDNIDEVKNEFKKIWQTDFEPTTLQIVKTLDVKFEMVWKNLSKFIDRLEIITDNSSSDERLTFDRSLREGSPLWGIIIGGNTLSRGLTLEGLSVSYFVRNSMTYDTLLQMGRWFGYRKGYVDLTRIFVPQNLYYAFYELATIEQEIRDEISLMSANQERPIDVALKIRKIPNFDITAANKRRSSVATSMSFDGQKIQTWQIVSHNLDIINKNKNAVDNLFRKLTENYTCKNPKFENLNKCVLFEGVDSELILQLLDQYFISDLNTKFNKKIVQTYIQEHLSIFKGWSVALMSKKNGVPIKFQGFEIIPLERNVSHLNICEDNVIVSTLRAVSTPGEELIDLEAEISNKFKAKFATTDDVLQQSETVRLSDTKARNLLRPNHKPLLMIFPLQYELSEPKESDFELSPGRTTFPLTANGQLFALTIVFPYSSDSNLKGKYVKNSTV